MKAFALPQWNLAPAAQASSRFYFEEALQSECVFQISVVCLPNLRHFHWRRTYTSDMIIPNGETWIPLTAWCCISLKRCQRTLSSDKEGIWHKKMSLWTSRKTFCWLLLTTIRHLYLHKVKSWNPDRRFFIKLDNIGFQFCKEKKRKKLSWEYTVLSHRKGFGATYSLVSLHHFDIWYYILVTSFVRIDNAKYTEYGLKFVFAKLKNKKKYF